jgi:hypothetical protein
MDVFKRILSCQKVSWERGTKRDGRAPARAKRKMDGGLNLVLLDALLAFELALVPAQLLGESAADVAHAGVNLIRLALAYLLHF